MALLKYPIYKNSQKKEGSRLRHVIFYEVKCLKISNFIIDYMYLLHMC